MGTSNDTTPIGVQDIIKSIPKQHDYYRSLVDMKDQKQAEKLVEERSRLLYALAIGEERTRLKKQVALDQQNRKQREKQIEKLEGLIARTDVMIRTKDRFESQIPDDQARQTVKKMDIAAVTVLLFLAAVVLCMGAANIYAIIMAAGIPAFLEQPQLAVVLSLLLPIGAAALKLLRHYLPTDRARKRYIALMFGVTAVSLMAWVVLFALVFGSAGDQSIDVDAMMDAASGGNTLGTAFTMVQLLAEMSVGATLFCVADDVLAKYSPKRMMNNPDYEETARSLERMKAGVQTETADEHKREARLQALEDGEKLYISEQLSLYATIRAQFLE